MSSRTWTGYEWEAYVQQLLKLHYGPHGYQEVPDQHGGDLGVEGFSTTGCAFQCYAPEGLIDTATTYERQRDKITADIAKFIANRDALAALFGPLKIHTWHLVTPSHVSHRLIQHANRKAKEVSEAKLPYVADGFRIQVITDEHFLPERAALVSSSARQVRLDVSDISSTMVTKWREAKRNSELLLQLDGKIKKLPSMSDERRRDTYLTALLKGFLRGQAVLDKLQSEHPSVYDRAVEKKLARERLLETSIPVSSARPDELFQLHLREFKQELEDALPAIAPDQVTDMVTHAVADWLMRCPLDFPNQQIV